MESIVLNELGHDGMRRIKIVSDAEIVSEKYGSMIPSDALDKASWSVGVDSILWLHTLEISFPVYGPHEVQYPSTKKFRRFMFVHYSYASRVSECVELARNAFMSSTGFPPMYAYIETLPKGADEFMTVHGCELFEAEWMPSNCVAVGGCDVG